MSDGAAARPRALALSLLASGLVVVVASDLRLVPQPSELIEGSAFWVRVVGVLALGLGVTMLWRRPAARESGSGATAPRTSAVRRAAAIVGVLTVTALLANPIRTPGPALGPGPTLGVPDPAPGQSEGGSARVSSVKRYT